MVLNRLQGIPEGHPQQHGGLGSGKGEIGFPPQHRRPAHPGAGLHAAQAQGRAGRFLVHPAQATTHQQSWAGGHAARSLKRFTHRELHQLCPQAQGFDGFIADALKQGGGLKQISD